MSNNSSESRRAFLSNLLKGGTGVGIATVAGTSFLLSGNKSWADFPADKKWEDIVKRGGETYNGCNCLGVCTCRRLCYCSCNCSGGPTSSTTGDRDQDFNGAPAAPTESAYNAAISRAKSVAINDEENAFTHTSYATRTVSNCD